MIRLLPESSEQPVGLDDPSADDRSQCFAAHGLSSGPAGRSGVFSAPPQEPHTFLRYANRVAREFRGSSL